MNKGNTNKGLGVIPEGWEVLPFDKVFEFIPSYAVSRDNLTDKKTNGGIQNIHYGDIHAKFTNEILDLSEVEELPFIKDEAINGKGLTFVKDGDLVIADVSEDYEGIGECVELINVGNKKVVGGLHTFVARPLNGKTANGFRCYILRNPAVRLNLKKLATGSNVYGVSKTNLTVLKLLLPPLPEQRKIAAMLGCFDKAIETTHKLIIAKQKQKKELVRLIIVEKGINWKNEKIKDIFSLKAGKDIETESFSFIETETHIYPVYSNSHEKKGLYGYYDKFQFDNSAVTVTARGAIGKACLREGKFNAIGRLLILIPRKAIDIKFVEEYINHCMNIFIESTGVPQLTAPQFGNMEIKLPPYKEQEKIALILSACDMEIQLLKTQLEKLKEEKRGLMKVLLTGEVRVKTTK